MAAEWPVVSLEEAGVSLIDCLHKTPPDAGVGYPYVAIPQMKEGRIDLDGVRRITPEAFREWTQKANPKAHDVLLSRRCNPGATAYVPPELQFAVGQNLVLLRADGTKVFPPFLRWWVCSPAWWNEIGRFINVGAVFDSLRCRDVPKFELPLPPLDEQRRIAAVLGALDDKIELNRKMNRTLEQMAQALFMSWFIDFDGHDDLVDSEIGPVPRGWGVGSLDDLSELNPESWSTRTRPAAIAYVDLANTKWGVIENVGEYLAADAPSRAQRVLRRGDTIVGTVRPGNGSYALVSRDGLTGSTGFAVLRPRAGSARAFVYLAATQAENIERLAHLADGGAYPAVRPDVVAATPAVVPPADVLDRFAAVADPLLDRIAANRVESSTLSTLRDTLLPKLISGELRVPEAEAAVLEAL